MAWAACGKDPGFTPTFLLDQASRHTAYTQSDLNRLQLRSPLELTELKKRWLLAMDQARALVDSLPPEELGCLYLTTEQRPVTPSPTADDFATLPRHKGSARGAWPTASSPIRGDLD